MRGHGNPKPASGSATCQPVSSEHSRPDLANKTGLALATCGLTTLRVHVAGCMPIPARFTSLLLIHTVTYLL